jgi:hypothetical protein
MRKTSLRKKSRDDVEQTKTSSKQSLFISFAESIDTELLNWQNVLTNTKSN